MAGWKGGFDKGFTRDEFTRYVATVKWTAWRPQFVTVHNSGAPNLEQWKATPGGEKQRLANLANYYRSPGPHKSAWSSGPNLFIGVEKIWIGTPLTLSGTHTPSWNTVALGMEIAGDYDVDKFEDPVKGNAVHALAVMHAALGLSPLPFKLGVRGLHFHREDAKTTHKHCPGKDVVKADLIKAVQAKILELHAGEHTLADEAKLAAAARR